MNFLGNPTIYPYIENTFPVLSKQYSTNAMKEKITQSLVLFFLIVVGAGITSAQRPQHVASESSTTTAFSKLRKHANQNTQKVAVHDDLPSAELDFEWNGADWDSLRQFVFLYNPNGSLAS